MKTLYIANTNFEFELKEPQTETLQSSLERHPLLLQLQFLPVLYADANDAIAVTDLPEPSYIDQLKSRHVPTFIRLKDPQIPPCDHLVSWGRSRQVQAWANQHNIPYAIPSWEVVKKVNSKAYSFENSPKLPQAELILNLPSLENWLRKISGPAVLKCCFGVSGRGNLKIKDPQDPPWNLIKPFCEKEWSQRLPIIAEPWVDKVCDFSTQWKITDDGEIVFIGAARFENDGHGTYNSTFSGPQETLFSGILTPFLEEHILESRRLLAKISQEGYRGHAGIDSMVYLKDHKYYLHPIVEVNARQTMSLAAIWLQRKWHPDKTIQLSYVKKRERGSGLLPEILKKKDGSVINFTRQLYFSLEQPTLIS